METERPEIERAEGGGDGGSQPAISGWWYVLALVAASVLIGLLGRFLLLTYDLSTDTSFAMRAASTASLTAAFVIISPDPKNLRQLGIVTVTGMVVGALVMVGYLPVAPFVRNLESSFQDTMVSLLGAALAFLLGLGIARLVYRWLGVPWSSFFPAKDRS